MNVCSSPSPWTCRYTAHVMPYLPRFRRVQGLASVANHHSATLSHTIVDIIATISRTHRRQATPRAGSGRASNSRQPSRKFPPQSLEARDSTIQALVLFMRPETAPLIVISTPRPACVKHTDQVSRSQSRFLSRTPLDPHCTTTIISLPFHRRVDRVAPT